MIEVCEETLREMFRQGYESCLREYAVWNNGEQLVGVRRRPLADVLAELHDEKNQQAEADCRIALQTMEIGVTGEL